MWVHCECDGVSPSQLALIEEEKHPLWSSAYYCSQCTPKRMLKVFQHLIQYDARGVVCVCVCVLVAQSADDEQRNAGENETSRDTSRGWNGKLRAANQPTATSQWRVQVLDV